MSKRTDKKRQKRFNEVHPTTTAPVAQPVVETAISPGLSEDINALIYQ